MTHGKPIFLAIFLIYFAFQFANAQSDFRPGFIITNDRDTIEGLVSFISNKQNTVLCKFKANADDQIITYDPSRLIAYGFDNGRFYISSYLIDIEKNKEEQVFYEVLVQGKASLLSYRGRLFGAKEEEGIQELKKITSVSKVYDAPKELNDYIPKLNFLFRDCKDGTILMDVQKSKLNAKRLTPIFEKYNQCVASEYKIYNNQEKWTKFDIGIALGANISWIRFIENDRPSSKYLSEGNFNPVLQPIIGIPINIFSPRLNESLAVNTGLWYMKSSYEGYSEIQDTEYSIERNNIYLDINTLEIPIIIAYSQRTDQAVINYKGGFTSNHNFQVKSRRISEREIITEKIIYTDEIITKRNEGHNFGICLGLGLQKKLSNGLNILSEVRLEKEIHPFNQVFAPVSLLGDMTNLHLSIGISF